MKYMHFNSSCSYAGLANLLAMQGVDTEDYRIALDMGLPYFLRHDEISGAYLNGPMLQSAEWFDLYLKPRGFRYIEHFRGKQEAVEQLCSGSMLGLQVTPKSKHAVIFLGKEEEVYKFLNNKWETSEEPEYLMLSKEECLERLPEQVVVGHLEPCMAKAADVETYLEDAIRNWENLRVELQEFISKEQSPQAVKDSMNRLFRPLLLDGISMAKLLEEKELEECLTRLQKRFLSMVRINEAVKPSEHLDSGEIDKAIDEFVSLVRNKIALLEKKRKPVELMNIQSIRESERNSHIELYSSEELYKEGSWLNKPVKTVTDLLPLFEGYKEFCALDLGSGVGRNSIAIAKQFKNCSCRVECVDILDLAIEKLKENARRFGVEECVHGTVCPIEEFDIASDTYDFILAVSALEHIDSKESFVKKLEEMREGVREHGVACLILNSEIKEKNKETGEDLLPQFEVNLSTKELQEILKNIFAGWEILKDTVREQQYDIPREGCISELSTKVVTYVVRKAGELW